jgi:hypothetical protein
MAPSRGAWQELQSIERRRFGLTTKNAPHLVVHALHLKINYTRCTRRNLLSGGSNEAPEAHEDTRSTMALRRGARQESQSIDRRRLGLTTRNAPHLEVNALHVDINYSRCVRRNLLSGGSNEAPEAHEATRFTMNPSRGAWQELQSIDRRRLGLTTKNAPHLVVHALHLEFNY